MKAYFLAVIACVMIVLSGCGTGESNTQIEKLGVGTMPETEEAEEEKGEPDFQQLEVESLEARLEAAEEELESMADELESLSRLEESVKAVEETLQSMEESMEESTGEDENAGEYAEESGAAETLEQETEPTAGTDGQSAASEVFSGRVMQIALVETGMMQILLATGADNTVTLVCECPSFLMPANLMKGHTVVVAGQYKGIINYQRGGPGEVVSLPTITVSAMSIVSQ